MQCFWAYVTRPTGMSVFPSRIGARKGDSCIKAWGLLLRIGCNFPRRSTMIICGLLTRAKKISFIFRTANSNPGPKGNQGKSPAVASGPKKDDKEEATEVTPEDIPKLTPAESPFHEFRLQLMQIKEQIQTMQAMQQWLLTSMRPLQQQHPMQMMQPMQQMQPMGMLANQAMTPFAR